MARKHTLLLWSGFGVGLVAGLLLRQVMRAPDLEAVARRYRLWAPFYHVFGVDLQERLAPVRDRLAEMAGLRPGARALDLACGTGGNLPYIRARVGATGRVVGVDYSPDMLQRAQKLIDAHGWTNVHLVRADAAALRLSERFDAVLCSFGLSAIPDYIAAMRCALDHLEPGGVFAAVDGRIGDGPMGAVLGHLVNLVSLVFGSDLSRRPWEWLAAHVTDFAYEESLFGALYWMAGRRPIRL